MAEKEYIERNGVMQKFADRVCLSNLRDFPTTTPTWNQAVQIVETFPAADVRPVVTCERCVYHVDCGYHYCNKWCVNCPDDADFFCAYGEEES